VTVPVFYVADGVNLVEHRASDGKPLRSVPLKLFMAAPEMAELLRSLGPAFAIASAPFVTTDDGTEPFDVRCLASRGSWAHQKLIEARDKVEAMLARIDG